MRVTEKVMCAGVYTTWCDICVPTLMEKRVASVFGVKKKNKVLLPRSWRQRIPIKS